MLNPPIDTVQTITTVTMVTCTTHITQISCVLIDDDDGSVIGSPLVFLTRKVPSGL